MTKAHPSAAVSGRYGPETFTIRSEGDDLVLHLSGSLDASTAAGLRKRLSIMRDLAGGGRLIVDLRDAHHLDPAVIDALRGAAAHCRRHTVEFLLRSPSLSLRSALRAARDASARVEARTRTRPGPGDSVSCA